MLARQRGSGQRDLLTVSAWCRVQDVRELRVALQRRGTINTSGTRVVHKFGGVR